jgi:hypothetical protein
MEYQDFDLCYYCYIGHYEVIDFSQIDASRRNQSIIVRCDYCGKVIRKNI